MTKIHLGQSFTCYPTLGYGSHDYEYNKMIAEFVGRHLEHSGLIVDIDDNIRDEVKDEQR
jgi:hypothetical protein